MDPLFEGMFDVDGMRAMNENIVSIQDLFYCHFYNAVYSGRFDFTVYLLGITCDYAPRIPRRNIRGSYSCRINMYLQ